jgi:hypothetical protein
MTSTTLLHSGPDVEDQDTNNRSDSRNEGLNNTTNQLFNMYSMVLSFIEGSLVRRGQSHNDDSDDNPEHPTLSTAWQRIRSIWEVAESSAKRLDEKQYIAYQIICCTLLLRVIRDMGDSSLDLGQLLGRTLNLTSDMKQSRDNLITKLIEMGGQEQLIMFLTGPAGCEKKHFHQCCSGVLSSILQCSCNRLHRQDFLA